MKMFNAVVFLAMAVAAKDSAITFRSRHIGKLPAEKDASLTIVAAADPADLDTKSVSFSSSRHIGGNWNDYVRPADA